MTILKLARNQKRHLRYKEAFQKLKYWSCRERRNLSNYLIPSLDVQMKKKKETKLF